MAASKRVRLDLSTTVCNLNCSVAFQELTNTEKLYAHFLAKASWQGSLIVFLQTSPESPVIFLLFQSLYSGQSISQLKADSLAITEGQVPTPTDFHVSLIAIHLWQYGQHILIYLLYVLYSISCITAFLKWKI